MTKRKAPDDTTRQLTDPLPVVDAPSLGDMELPDDERGALQDEMPSDDLLKLSGDMRGFEPPPANPNALSSSAAKKPRSPVVATMAFLQLDIPLVIMDALQAWLLDTNHDTLPDPEDGSSVPYKSLYRDQVAHNEYNEAFEEFLLDAIGRDLDLDEDRPLTERHYNQPAWLGKSFRSTLAQYQTERIQQATSQAVSQYQQSVLVRLQAQYPEVPIDQWHYLLDIPTI